MHADIPALIGLLIAPLEVFAARYDQLAEDARLATAAQLFVSYLRLAETETAAAALGSKLAAFAAEPQVGMRVHHMHGVGRDLARILARLGQLRPAFEHLGLEFDMAAMDRLTVEVSQMRQNLQATQSPDPLQFPSQGVIQSAQAALAPLPAQLADITGKLGQIVSRHPARGQKVRWQAPTAVSDPPMASDVGVDYTALRDLLAAGSWRAAYAETQRTMLVAVSKAEHRTGVPPALFIEHVTAFPCTDLRTLDNLWAWASGGRFGFSTQLGIYRGLRGTDMYDFSIWWAFCYRVGWVIREPIYSIGAPIGHLPWIARAGVMGLDSHDALVRSVDMDEEARGRFLFGIFFDRVAHCLKASADQLAPAS